MSLLTSNNKEIAIVTVVRTLQDDLKDFHLSVKDIDDILDQVKLIYKNLPIEYRNFSGFNSIPDYFMD